MKLALLLLPVLLMTLPASALKPKLLAVGTHCPNIIAKDAHGTSYHLHSLQGKKRVVLLSTQNAAYLNNVSQHQAQFTKRDLVMLMTDWPSYTFYLVGKDGYIKMAQYVPPTNAELFATIDAMPMRQQEMRSRK